LTVCVPEAVFAPLHPPEAVQEVALVEDHVKVDDEPELTEVGLAEMEIVGGGVIVIVAPVLHCAGIVPNIFSIAVVTYPSSFAMP